MSEGRRKVELGIRQGWWEIGVLVLIILMLHYWKYCIIQVSF